MTDVLPTARHPESGLGYVHVVPGAWGPFVDIRACYQSFASRTPWSGIVTPETFQRLRSEQHASYLDPATVFVLWSYEEVDPRPHRGASMLMVYSEAIGERATMLPDHQRDWDWFRDKLAPTIDGVLAHTPRMRDYMRRAGFGAAILPVGWDEHAMGTPRWNTEKFRDYVFQGSMTGRREWLMPGISRLLGHRYADVSGLYGRRLLGELDNARASLYIAHSKVWSFSTWRIWQCIATSAALVAERGDAWPAVPGTHYVELPEITLETATSVCEYLRVLPQEVDLLEVSKRAHEELAHRFTIDRCVEEYLVPASLALRGSR